MWPSARNIAIVLVSIILASHICLSTGLIEGGRGYSSSTPYRRQTNAMLAGQIALSDSPTTIEHDMVWANGGVQQVWGLGAPAWRLVFEVAARSIGQAAFPDRYALLFAIAIASALIIHALTATSGPQRVGDWFMGLGQNGVRTYAAFLLIYFPPIITLCRGPFNVYEEAIIYSYYYSVAMGALAFLFKRSPSFGLYVFLSLMAGAAGFVRPTMLAYGASTVMVATICAKRFRWHIARVLIGPLVAVIAGCLLLQSNSTRFGDALEFGHKLNLTSFDLMYASRFESAFQKESSWKAGRELFGSAFFTTKMDDSDLYSNHNVRWQSESRRWRHFYHSTFTPSYFILACSVWLWACCQIVLYLYNGRVADSDLLLASFWSIIGIFCISGFFLRFHAMSSRYILDYAPGIAIALAGGLIAIGSTPYFLRSRFRIAIVWCAGLVWWIYQIQTAWHLSPPTSPVDRQTACRAPAISRAVRAMPDTYDRYKRPADVTGIAQNGLGWNLPSGQTRPVVVFFASMPKELAVDVEPSAPEALSAENYACIQAKVGLEELTLKSVRPTATGKRLIFAAPVQQKYRNGTQVIFLKMAPVDGFLLPLSQFIITKVTFQELNE